MILMPIDEYVDEYSKKLPFTVQVLSHHHELKTNRQYTVTRLYIDRGRVLAKLLEFPVPITYIPDQFQIMSYTRPN